MWIPSNEYIQKLNANTEGGRFVKLVTLVEDPGPPTIRYFADNPEPIIYNGQTYQPMWMAWGNIKVSQAMPIDGCTVSVSNLGNVAANYVKTIDISENAVTLELVHMSLLGQTTGGHWELFGEVISVQADDSMAVITVGLQLGKNVLPNKVFLASEFHGLNSEIPKILT